MRSAVVFFEGRNRRRLLGLAQALARGVEAQGHQVDVIDGSREVNRKLTIYRYVAVGAEPVTFLAGKLPPAVVRYLKDAGMVSGKRSYAFVSKATPSSARALQRLMTAMEAEGMYVKNSGVLASEVEAEAIGRRLHVA